MFRKTKRWPAEAPVRQWPLRTWFTRRSIGRDRQTKLSRGVAWTLYALTKKSIFHESVKIFYGLMAWIKATILKDIFVQMILFSDDSPSSSQKLKLRYKIQ